MNRRNILTFLAMGLGYAAGALAGFRGARYKARRASASRTVDFEVSSDEPFPVRALDPVLHIGDVELRDYRYGNNENTILIFTCGDPDQLQDDAPVYFQYENDERTRTDLPNFQRSMIG
jgi:hypothetical protein